jgi:hypothetical protein
MEGYAGEMQKEMRKIKEQLDAGQGLTACQGRILMQAYVDAARTTATAMGNRLLGMPSSQQAGLCNAYLNGNPIAGLMGQWSPF